MKTNIRNIILVFFLALFTIASCKDADAQDRTTYLHPGTTYTSVTLGASDTISNNDTIYWVLVEGLQHYPTTQTYVVHLDSVSGAPAVSIQLQGRVSTLEAWTNIGSAKTWAGTTADTTITFANTTANRYRYYKIGFDGTATANKILVNSLEFKLWLE